MIFLSTMVVNCFSEALKRNVTFHAVLPVDKRSFDGAGPRDDRPMKTLYLLHGVYEDGSVYDTGINIHYADGGVRPAMWVLLRD